MIPLFEIYPRISHKIPHASLGEFPTPIKKMENAGREIGMRKLFVKRDDMSGRLYGGNKVRKLEFLLGDAIQRNVRSVLTFGAAGSNHALATAVYAGKLGLRCILHLIPQPNATYVRKNLLMDSAAGAELKFFTSRFAAQGAAFFQTISAKIKRQEPPMVIPFGGTTPLANIGFVNAAFELRDQVENGRMPEPDVIYVPLGSMGTAVGLMLGIKACGMKSRVVAVRVVPYDLANERKVLDLFSRTSSFMNAADPAFPRYELPEHQLDIRHDFYGMRYALYTQECVKAVELVKKHEGLQLEGTYTGKAFAALMDDARRGMLKDKVVLFWNTYNSRDLSPVTDRADYRSLPLPLQRYFIDNLQPLERK